MDRPPSWGGLIAYCLTTLIWVGGAVACLGVPDTILIIMKVKRDDSEGIYTGIIRAATGATWL